MDDINRSISEYVKSGQYYEDAKNAYIGKYILPFSERSYLLVIICFYIFTILVSVYYYQNTNPAQEQVRYMVSTDDISTSYAVIQDVGSDKVAPQINIAKYILGNYVVNRESYVYNDDKMQDQLNFVRNTTVGTEYLKYKEMNSIDSPYSSIMIYQDNYTRNAQIKKVDLLKSKGDVKQAMVYFQANLKNVASNQIISEDFVATINFKIDNIETLIENNAKTLGFLVTEYSVRKITKQGK
jgi:type IV secretion system protein VirB8